MNKKRTVKPKALKPSNRLFLVVADDSKELHQALYYAARRAATAGGNPGPLINYIINKGSNECRVPITIVPGNLSDEQIDALI